MGRHIQRRGDGVCQQGERAAGRVGVENHGRCLRACVDCHRRRRLPVQRHENHRFPHTRRRREPQLYIRPYHTRKQGNIRRHRAGRIPDEARRQRLQPRVPVNQACRDGALGQRTALRGQPRRPSHLPRRAGEDNHRRLNSARNRERSARHQGGNGRRNMVYGS